MKLLIAEDEIRAREGLRQLIPPEFDQVLAFGNGQDALAAAIEMEPDVVLCDVRMPKMNGIELARQLRLRFSDLHILFISAYSDKEYLKSAISIQADGYLEKPIDEEELLDYLRRVAGEIKARQQAQRRHSDLAELFARQQTLRALLRRDDAQEAALALNPALTHEVLNARRYLPVSLRMQWPDDSAAARYGFFSEVRLSEMLSQISPNHLFASLSERQIGLLFYGDDVPSREDCRRGLTPVLEALREANPQALNACACVGEPFDDCDALHAHYSAAHLQVSWMCFAAETPCAIGTTPALPAPPPEDRSAQFAELLGTHQPDAAKQLIRAQTREIIQRGSGSIDQVRRYYGLLLNACLRAAAIDQSALRNAKAAAEVTATFARLGTLSELCRFICVRIDDIAPPVASGSRDSGIIRDAQDYIRQNLADPSLSVQSVADNCGLSENYLNALYKRETGQTLHRVIVELRMERAKYLLAERVRVPEVAKRCGFSSTGYFHSVFKKHTGLSPAAYAERAARDGGRPGGEG